jgi:hypothetical protein
MSDLGDWLALLFVLAIVYVLVRPRSGAGEAVTAIGDMLVSMVRRAVDLAG